MTPSKSRTSLFSKTLTACVASLATCVFSSAQTSPAATPSTQTSENVVQMSKFEVQSTQDRGYTTSNAASGFKTNQELIKIPQSILVITSDLVKDIGATKTSDVLAIGGASQFYRGESVRLRGARTLNPYLDDAIENVPYSDNVNIDTYEVIRGPAGVLYANAGVGGIVLKSTKKPLPFDQQIVNATFTSEGTYRAEVDSTGPLGNLGDARVSYRAVGAYQGGDTYLKNMKDDRLAFHPTMQFDFRNATIRVALDYVDIDSLAGGQNFVLPNGKLYTGAGRDEGYYAKGIMENHQQNRQRAALLFRFADNWESKTSISHLHYERQGTNLLPQGLNLVTNELTLFARRNYQRQQNWVLNQDIIGTYKLGSIENQSAAGFGLTDEYVRSSFPRSTTFGGGTGAQAFSISNPRMDSVVVPSFNSYDPPSTFGSWTNNRRATYYYQHQATVIPDRLILVAGWSAASLQINDVPNVNARNTAGGTRIVQFNENLHRYGIVFNPLKDVAIYVLDSTTFAPQGNSNTRDVNGLLLPAQVGKGQEFGIKTSLFGGRFSSTLSFFDIELTNVAVLQGGLSPITQQPFFRAAGIQFQKGWDGNIAWAPIPEWQIIATAYKGTVEDQTGAKVNNTYDSLYSFFTRYEFREGSVKGLSIGGGASKTGGNYFSTQGSSYIYPTGVTPAPIIMESVWNMNLFAGYVVNKNWTVRVNIENVLDKAFVLGAQTPIYVDPSPPRTFTFGATYKF